jgi:hypothetical protein
MQMSTTWLHTNQPPSLQANDESEALRADLHHHQAQQAAMWGAHQQLTASHAALADSLADLQAQYAALQEEHEVLAEHCAVLLQRCQQGGGGSAGMTTQHGNTQQQVQLHHPTPSATCASPAGVPCKVALGDCLVAAPAAETAGLLQERKVKTMSPRHLLQHGFGDACLIIRVSPSKTKAAGTTITTTTTTTGPCAPVTPPAGVVDAAFSTPQQLAMLGNHQGAQVLPPPAPTPPPPSAVPPCCTAEPGCPADTRGGEESSAFGSFVAQAWFGGLAFSCPASPLLPCAEPASDCTAPALQTTGTVPASCTEGEPKGGTLGTSASVGAARVLVWGPSGVKPVHSGTIAVPLKPSSSLDSSISASTLLGVTTGHNNTGSAAVMSANAAGPVAASPCAATWLHQGATPHSQSQSLQQQGMTATMSIGTRLSGSVLSIPGDVPSDEELARALAEAKQQGAFAAAT